jgi:hypothetical protein
MDNAISVTGPYPASPTVRHCDTGGHRLGPGQPWWLITDPTRGWHHNAGASCAAHRPAQGAVDQGHLYRVGDLFAPTAPVGRKAHTCGWTPTATPGWPFS